MKKLFRGATIFLFLLGFVLLFAGQAQCETINLKMSHFMPTKHPQHKVMEDWAKNMESLSGGKLKITIFPGGALGKPPHQYESAVKGITDMAFGLHSYTPGRFPLTSVMELPFMVKNGEQGSLVLWSLYEKYLRDEFKDTKTLWMFCHGAGQLFTTKKQVKTLDDLKGLKIRSPGPIMSKVLKRLGATPVSMPITQVYTGLERKTIDGVVVPWEAMRPFRLYEKCKYATEADIYTMTFFVTMNKKKYESLPADLKKLVDENTGEKMSYIAGKAYDAADGPSREFCIKKGVNVYKLPDAERERWRNIANAVGDQWIEDMAAKGLPGQEILESTVEALMQTE